MPQQLSKRKGGRNADLGTRCALPPLAPSAIAGQPGLSSSPLAEAWSPIPASLNATQTGIALCTRTPSRDKSCRSTPRSFEASQKKGRNTSAKIEAGTGHRTYILSSTLSMLSVKMHSSRGITHIERKETNEKNKQGPGNKAAHNTHTHKQRKESCEWGSTRSLN